MSDRLMPLSAATIGKSSPAYRCVGCILQVIFRARHTTCEGAKAVRIVLSPSDFFKMEVGANCLRDQSPYHAPIHLHLDPAARQPEGRKLRIPAAFRAREY